MPTEYEQNTELDGLVQRVLSEPDFSSLVTHEVSITSCLKIKMNEDSEYVASKGDAAQLKKVGPPFSAFIDKHYIVVFDAYAWHNFPNRREAAIHKALMRISVRLTDSGEIKFGNRTPDVQEFTATVRRYGQYSDELVAFALASASEELGRIITQ
jgi:hypothetical protein